MYSLKSSYPSSKKLTKIDGFMGSLNKIFNKTDVLNLIQTFLENENGRERLSPALRLLPLIPKLNRYIQFL